MRLKWPGNETDFRDSRENLRIIGNYILEKQMTKANNEELREIVRMLFPSSRNSALKVQVSKLRGLFLKGRQLLLQKGGFSPDGIMPELMVKSIFLRTTPVEKNIWEEFQRLKENTEICSVTLIPSQQSRFKTVNR